VREDLKRRDFTINAMAVNEDMEIIDPFNGQSDIEKGLVTTVGYPLTRFQEDFLRIVRAIRFAARFDFHIGHNEKRAMIDHADKVAKNVSVERVMMETKKAMKDDHPTLFLDWMDRLGIFEDFLDAEIYRPNFNQVEHVENLKDRMILLVEKLLYSIDNEEVKKRLSLSNEIFDKAEKMGVVFELLSTPISETNRRKVLAANTDVLSEARRIGTQAKGIPEKRFEKPDVPLEPIVSGQDLIDAGLEEGPAIGEFLDEAHRIQLEESITDKSEILNRVL